MTASLSYAKDLLKASEDAMNAGDLDLAESLLNSALRKAAKANTNNSADDDDDFGDGPSATSMGADNGDDDDDQDDDEDEDDEAVDKMLRTLRKDEAFLDRGRGHRSMRGVVGHEQAPTTYRTDMAPTVEQPKHHKFETKIAEIAMRDKVPKHVAQATARLEHPGLYEDYQNSLARQSTIAQHVTRGMHFVDKRASGNALVQAEMAKGLSYEAAAQRIAQQYGFPAFNNQLSKGERLTDRFAKRVDALIDEGYTGTEACELVRKLDPALYRAMQVV
jgi:hypothetical protein